MKKTLMCAALAGACLSMPLAHAVSAAAPAAAKAQTAAAQFKTIYTREWAWRVAQGLADDGSGDVDASLPRVDAATQAMRRDVWAAVLAQLKSIDAAALPADARIDYAVYRAQVQALYQAQVFREYEKPMNADSAFWSDLTGDIDKPFATAAGYERYLARLKQLPRYFAEQTDNMRAGLARGFTPPRVTLTGRDVSLATVADAAPEATPFYRPLADMPASIPAAERERLRGATLAVIRDAVLPAYKSLLSFVRDDYIPHANTALAAEDQPDGKAYYRSKIVEFTTVDMAPEAIHALGLAEMAKVRAEMAATIAQTDFKGDFPAFLNFLRTDPRFYAKTPEELLMRAAWIAKRFDGKAAQYFGYLPRQRFGIIPVPPDQAPFYTSGRGGPGVYLVNTYDLPSRALYSLPALTLHESAPGHAFQMPIAAEQKNRPRFRNEYISAYGEGWALYCERLGSEMGIYQTPYETFGMLSYQAWRVARLVVDTGIHSMHWTRAQAQDYLRENTALSQHEIETEVDRYISWPGQALSYYLGETAILDARHRAESALGARFDLRAFHDTVLQLGSVPLPVLQARIDAFIADGGRSPYPNAEGGRP
jgi:uncharacterized protein (DUF885 family)